MPKSVWNEFLSDVVSGNNRVDFERARILRPLLNAWLEKLERVSLSELSRFEQVACIINAHNAYAIDLVLRSPNAETLRDIPSYRHKYRRWVFAGEPVNLQDLEWRLRSEYADPRILLALSSGTRSGPGLRSEAYSGFRLRTQLDKQAREFLQKPTGLLVIGQKSGTFAASRILDWYRPDFGGKEGVRDFILHYTDHPGIRELRYLDYDWRL